MINIRPYELGDKEPLRRLVSEVWSGRPQHVFDNRWWWRTPTPPLFVAADDETKRIVGMCAAIPSTVFVSGTSTPTAWFVDFFVAPDQQGKGLGKALTIEVMNRYPLTASLLQSDAAWAAFRKLGWGERVFVDLHLHLAPFLWHRRAKRPPTGLTVVSRPFDAHLSGSDAAEIDRLWDATHRSYDAIGARDSATLNERYTGFRGRTYRLSIARRGGEAAGYMISRVLPRNSLRSMRRAIGLVVDYLVSDDDATVFDALLQDAAAASVASGARAMLCMSTSRNTRGVLSSAGYVHAQTPLLGRKLQSLRVGFTCHGGVAPSARWFLTPGDCDLDLVWGETPNE